MNNMKIVAVAPTQDVVLAPMELLELLIVAIPSDSPLWAEPGKLRTAYSDAKHVFDRNGLLDDIAQIAVLGAETETRFSSKGVEYVFVASKDLVDSFRAAMTAPNVDHEAVLRKFSDEFNAQYEAARGRLTDHDDMYIWGSKKQLAQSYLERQEAAVLRSVEEIAATRPARSLPAGRGGSTPCT